jgi:hypothetical protein
VMISYMSLLGEFREPTEASEAPITADHTAEVIPCYFPSSL